jgi:hypothetical protein
VTGKRSLVTGVVVGQAGLGEGEVLGPVHRFVLWGGRGHTGPPGTPGPPPGPPAPPSATPPSLAWAQAPSPNKTLAFHKWLLERRLGHLAIGPKSIYFEFRFFDVHSWKKNRVGYTPKAAVAGFSGNIVSPKSSKAFGKLLHSQEKGNRKDTVMGGGGGLYGAKGLHGGVQMGPKLEPLVGPLRLAPAVPQRCPQSMDGVGRRGRRRKRTGRGPHGMTKVPLPSGRWHACGLLLSCGYPLGMVSPY